MEEQVQNENSDMPMPNQNLGFVEKQDSAKNKESTECHNREKKSDNKCDVPFTVNSIFGPEGLLAKISKEENDVNNDKNEDDYENSSDLHGQMSGSGVRPRSNSGLSEPMDQDQGDLENDIEIGQQPASRSLKKRKLFPGPNDSDINVNVTTIPLPSDTITIEQNESEKQESETGSTPIQVAFGIELIVRKIFFYLPIRDLKQSRLVCSHWAHNASKSLQKLIKISFHYRLETPNESGYINCYDSGTSLPPNHDYFNPESQKSLKSLTQLLENKICLYNEKQSENGSQNQHHHGNSLQNNSIIFPSSSYEFPCNFFEFYPAILTEESLQNFLTSHGTFVKKLKLYLNYFSKEHYNSSSLPLLQTLLVDQVPLLTYLELRMDISEEIEEDTKNLEFLMQSASGTNEKESFDLPNLLVLKMWDGVHRGILEGLFLSAKNLREVCLESENLHYLLESGSNSSTPRNRLHLLKKLTLDLDYDDVNSMEIIASHSDSLRLRKLTFHLNHQYSLQKHWPRVTTALNKILKSSALTLEKIIWGPIGVLKGVEIPRMPRLKKLTMEIEELVGIGEIINEVDRSKYFFPNGFKIMEMFPKLSTIFLLNGWMIAKHGFGRYFSIREGDVVSSLKYFRINHLSRNRVSEEDLEWFARSFPNAKLLFWPNITSGSVYTWD